ncbi:hypothetical protein [Marinagarivorans cellulosilyticus]|uniref:Uncharacterized protein n=1 Tax=Marinagarivorans cellulosilyticus TaxID=2721545 RepID=A0AAN1WF55_9GAMM|nr:hypothetical protein [Marinagarivorans cellulosilyticus]BCD96456.1 hypothetical protein MARGE09_P0656 [Marinagarivorans cellulosilyticus]
MRLSSWLACGILTTAHLYSGAGYAEITGYPWSSGFSAVSSESDGEKLSFSFQQGVEWSIKSTDWTISPFIGLNYDRSNILRHSWNNSTKPKYGIEVANQFRFGPINWGEFRVGVQNQKYYYRDNITLYRETERKEAYVRMYMNGNWAR